MNTYTTFWKTILEQFKVQFSTQPEKLHYEIPNSGINSIGKREETGYNGSVESFAFKVRNFKDSAVFRDLKAVLTEDKWFKETISGLLKISISGNDLVTFNYEPFSNELMMNRYRDSQDSSQMSNELCKWKLVKDFQDNWKEYEAKNINFTEFFLNIKWENLIYFQSSQLLKSIVKTFPQELEKAVLNLYRLDVEFQTRIETFKEIITNLHKGLNLPESYNSNIDERAISTLLTFRYPEHYTFYKSSYYNVLVKCLQKESAAAWAKLAHYYQIVNEFKLEVLPQFEDIIAIKNNLTKNDEYYHDNNHLLLIQDIFYITLEKAEDFKAEKVETNNDKTNLIKTLKQFKYEEVIEYLKSLDIIKNKYTLYPKDERIVFSIVDKRLNFLIGQRYILNLFPESQRSKEGVYTVISSAPFGNRSGEFSGKPLAYFNRIDSLSLNNQEWASVYNAIEIELTRSEKSGYKSNNSAFEAMVFDSVYRNEILELAFGVIKKEMNNNINSKNTILYGPPGTGKTYHTIDLAVAIIDKEIKDHKTNKLRFDKLIETEQIKFVTFHQSMSYEDFIEGIKPKVSDDGLNQVIYQVDDGIFKEACAMAAYFCYKQFIASRAKLKNYSFDDLYDAFVSKIQDQMNVGQPSVFKSLKGSEIEVKAINKNDSIIARAKDSVAKSSAPLTKENLQKLYDKFASITEINDLQQIKDTVQITPRITEFYAVFRGLKEFEKTYKPDALVDEMHNLYSIDKDKIIVKFNEGVYKEATKIYGEQAEPVILIIDEINRGNVSQIFGELITLIEVDKRIGAQNALSTTLPYSKKGFSIPSNLYIIGTMNTADRSVEALDTALRRRFSFVEMPPIYNLPELEMMVLNNKLSDLLFTINKRIEKLLGKDNLIGHAYFMDVHGEDDLKSVFQDKIIPLLQEYFFGDYSKIGLVLGRGFIELNENKTSREFFADFHHDSKDELLERPTWKIADVKAMSSYEFSGAINLLMGKPKTAASEAIN